MPKLILVEGKSGSGKTTLAKYMETDMNYGRVAIDDYIDELRKPSNLKLGFFSYQMNRAEPFSHRFYRERGKLPYTMDTALDVVRKHAEEMQQRILIPAEDAFHIWYAVWDRMLSDRDSALARGDTVMEAFTTTYSRTHLFRSDTDVERYLVRLLVPDAALVQRLVDGRGWDAEVAGRRTSRPLNTSAPGSGITLLEYRNETPEDLDKIKEDIRKRLA